MKLRISKYILLLVMSVFALASCSEDDNSSTEYANWQERNTQAFADTLAYAKKMGEANGWYVYRSWSLDNQTPNPDLQVTTPTYNDHDYIVVHVLEKGTGTTSPILTDSVQISYRGRYIPTDSYKEGYVFDQSFSGAYDATTASPVKGVAGGFVDGFTTALLKMHPGDRWQVFIPCQLGYGTSDYSASSSSVTIPAYSMLRFEVALVSYKHPSGKKWITE